MDRVEFLGLNMAASSFDDVLRLVKLSSSAAPFAYVVTPNVDHVVRLHRAPAALGPLYRDAALCLCDSRILQALARLAGRRLGLVPGSDLTARLFAEVIAPDDPLSILGGDAASIETLKQKYGLTNVAHHNPPMGFIDDPDEVDRCVDFVVAHPARFVFFAVGSPQQEIVAHRVLAHRLPDQGGATGMGLCTGAGIDFLTGRAVRAPTWMRRAGLEWLHRLAQDPKRMWRRYLFGGPKIFLIYLRWLLRGSRAD